jgi:hypothetical protein
MTTKTSITCSHIKHRWHGSPHLRKRRTQTSVSIDRRTANQLALILSTRSAAFPTTITIQCQKHIITSTPLPDLLNDIGMDDERQQETITTIANLLRHIGDQLDEQYQVV